MQVQNIQNQIDTVKTQLAFKAVEHRRAIQKNVQKEIDKLSKQLEELNAQLVSLQESHDNLLTEKMTKLGFRKS